MATFTKKRIIQLILFAFFAAGIVFAVQLQLGLINIDQEFGTYGPYNRTLNTVEEMEELETVSSRLRRRYEFGYLSSLENFSLKVKDDSGQTAVISFGKGTPEFDESNRERLKAIILEKTNAAFAEADTR
ncbi:MAG: hypothetical protein ACI92G_001672 [Candidatus Pelagisphaera sp.]|jgi:hypothetical protein